MDVGIYFGTIILVLTALILITLILAFLYLIYGKEEPTE